MIDDEHKSFLDRVLDRIFGQSDGADPEPIFDPFSLPPLEPRRLAWWLFRKAFFYVLARNVPGLWVRYRHRAYLRRRVAPGGASVRRREPQRTGPGVTAVKGKRVSKKGRSAKQSRRGPRDNRPRGQKRGRRR
ncbi:hypothetical protein ACIRBX_25040 [Kitasatospora sp. NPDC096147]|uniref:hypothetical protein n=1 Tax=Kitasatospora sp. NPDC096147 TaxID=3364093 RepID=UPI00381D74E3